MKATVHYQVATYSGDVVVFCSDDSDDDHVLALARKELRKAGGSLPFGYQSFRVVLREVES